MPEIYNLTQEELSAIILTVLFSAFFVQVLKTAITSVKNKKFMPHVLLSTGGMPSSHSAIVSSTCSILFAANNYQLSVPFLISVVLAVVVIHDSMGIRLEASKHAKMLNEINSRYYEGESAETPKKLKELLGHRPIEVLVGTLIGIVIPLIVWTIYKGF